MDSVSSPRTRTISTTALPMHPPNLEPVKRGVSLIFPIPHFFQNVRDLQISQVLRLLVANLGGHVQTQRRAVLPRERPIIHFVAEQCLRMQGRSHVQRFVIVIRTLNTDKPRRAVRSNYTEKIRKPSTAKAANDVPAFHADVASILPN